MALTLANILNLHLFYGREDGVNTDPTALPTVAAGGTYNNTIMTLAVNDAIQQFLEDTGQAPSLTEVKATLPIVAGADFTLPAGLVDLFRVEYKIGAGQPRLVPIRDFNTFDEETGAGLGLADNGYPLICRQPYAGQIRLWPVPTAGNVTAGDTITLYYSSNGNVLVNPTDVPGFPGQFHRAIVHYLLIETWLRKQDEGQSAAYERLYERGVNKAKAYIFNSSRGTGYSIGDVEQDESGTAEAGGFFG